VLSSKPRVFISRIGMSLPRPWSRPLWQTFGHQDLEQNARDKLDVLKQTGSVEDYANKFQFLVAEIVAMPPSEGGLLQRFNHGLKPDIHMVASIDPITGTRWMNLQKFISFACATDASRAQANKGKQVSDKSEQGKSSSSGASYKDKLKGKRPNEPPSGQPAKKAKTGPEKLKSKLKAKDWEHNSCFICHKAGHRAKECPYKPKNTRVDFAKTNKRKVRLCVDR
jgi:hypothetical protein